TNIQNLDLKFELFPSAGEIVSFAAFYKKIIDPIEYARSLNYSDRSIRSLNTGDAYVKGIEAELRKKIDFIPFAPWLKNVTLFANGSLLESKVNSIDINTIEFQTVAEHTLTGQPDYIINAGISIGAFRNTFETTLNYNRTGDYVYQLGSAAKVEKQSYLPTPVARLLARDLLDLVVTQSLFKNKCKIKLSAGNLLNKPYIIYQDTNGNKKFDAPIKVKPFSVMPEIDAAYESGIDAVYLSVQPQRTYSFSISYTF
ncbi:MAG TPA: TonB-dependent receptor, partial [Chitinophagaceae bacterium]|nr:TonB-dependent receptor [Chitinophagaceae bacterium]